MTRGLCKWNSVTQSSVYQNFPHFHTSLEVCFKGKMAKVFLGMVKCDIFCHSVPYFQTYEELTKYPV